MRNGWRSARQLILGRGVDNWVRRVLAAPLFPDVDGSGSRSVQLVHSDDVHRVFVRAVDRRRHQQWTGEPCRARGADTASDRRCARAADGAAGKRRLSSPELDRLLSAPSMDTALLHDKWNFTPAWSAEECVYDVALAVRGRVSVGKRLMSLPWRLTHVQDIPSVDVPAADGVPPVLGGSGRRQRRIRHADRPALPDLPRHQFVRGAVRDRSHRHLRR